MVSKYRVKISTRAQIDLDGIFNYVAISLSNSIAANKLMDEFEEKINEICSFPEGFPLIENEMVNNKSIRKAIVEKYIIFYKIDYELNYIYVVRVLYGMSNWFLKL